MANSEDPDEMPHNAAFHQSLHCLLGQKWYTILFGINNLRPLNMYNGVSQV